MYVVHLAKEPFKFSCSHFTILSSTHGERLHGHNYQLRVALKLKEVDSKLGLAFDFNAVKPKVRMLCDELDERILLPKESPYLKIQDQKGQIEVQFNQKKYSFPAEDVLLLPIVNVTSEELARYVSERLNKLLHEVPSWIAVRVNVEETRGQSVSYTLKR